MTLEHNTSYNISISENLHTIYTYIKVIIRKDIIYLVHTENLHIFILQEIRKKVRNEGKSESCAFESVAL